MGKNTNGRTRFTQVLMCTIYNTRVSIIWHYHGCHLKEILVCYDWPILITSTAHWADAPLRSPVLYQMPKWLPSCSCFSSWKGMKGGDKRSGLWSDQVLVAFLNHFKNYTNILVSAKGCCHLEFSLQTLHLQEGVQAKYNTNMVWGRRDRSQGVLLGF